MLPLRLSSLLLPLLLSGCVLQSDKPLFTETDGVAALEPLGTELVSYSRNEGDWKREDDPVTLVLADHHYVDATKPTEAQFLFVALGGEAYVMEAKEEGKPAVYALARRDGKAMLVYPLMCDVLKKDAVPHVRFQGDDCFTEQGFGVAEFKNLLARAGEARIKLAAE